MVKHVQKAKDQNDEDDEPSTVVAPQKQAVA